MNEQLICYTAWEFGTRTATYIGAFIIGIFIGRIITLKDKTQEKKQ